MNLLGRAVLAITQRPLVRRLITDRALGRRLSSRFVAGERLEDALEVAHRLNRSGGSVSLDHLGEHVTDRSQAVDARGAYLDALDRIEAERLDANISVKLTQLGLGIDEELMVESLAALAARAGSAGTTVTIDMEDSAYTEATIAAFEKVQPTFGNLGIALQAYLHRTPEDLERLLPLGGHIRLCKGAYAEPPHVALQKRSQVDAAFDRLLQILMAAPATMPAVATHDEQRIAQVRSLAVARPAPWELQMLYGVRRPLQRDLIRSGVRLRVYVPYGGAWYPYLTRRLAERPANLVFFLRALAGR